MSKLEITYKKIRICAEGPVALVLGTTICTAILIVMAIHYSVF
jgi:hypothetical protein